MRPQTPTGRPYPSAAQAGPEGLGCNRRCVGESSADPYGPTPSPRVPCGARGTGVPQTPRDFGGT